MYPLYRSMVALGLLAAAVSTVSGISGAEPVLNAALSKVGLGFQTVGVGGGLERRVWMVAGIAREALISVPEAAKSDATPVVFAFHGHGGSMQNVARSFFLHTLWPEALVVYPQGLNTPGRLTDPEGRKAGWQVAAGAQGDRDLAFIDAMLAGLKGDFRVDEKRIYATGHSNGGAFTYLLWAKRGEIFAAFAPSSSILVHGNTDPHLARPLLHIAGEKDPLVKFTWQQQSIAVARRINGCAAAGEPWPKAGSPAMIYPSKINAPVVTLIHPGGHIFFQDAPELIVRFFRDHPRL